MKWTAEKLRDEVRHMDPNLSEDDRGFSTALLLLSLLVVDDRTITGLVEFTGLPRMFVADRIRRLRANGVLVGRGQRSKIVANWADEEDGGASFWLDVCVADGLMEKRRA